MGGVLFEVELGAAALVVVVAGRVLREPHAQYAHLLGKDIVEAPEAGEGRGAATYERALIPALVFLKATKQRACALANEDSLPVRYLIDPATRSLLVVPDKQMEDFRRVLDLSTDEGGLLDRPLTLGERVRVTKGVLAGVEGRVLELRGRTYVVVQLLDSWFAKASVPRAWLEPIDR